MPRPLNNKMRQQVMDVITTDAQSKAQPGWGIVLTYDALTNSATVLMSRPGGDDTGETYANVPCPVNMGVQGVAPEPGRSCMVTFKHGNSRLPVITNFFNYDYATTDRPRQAHAITPLPRFMMDM